MTRNEICYAASEEVIILNLSIIVTSNVEFSPYRIVVEN